MNTSTISIDASDQQRAVPAHRSGLSPWCTRLSNP